MVPIEFLRTTAAEILALNAHMNRASSRASGDLEFMLIYVTKLEFATHRSVARYDVFLFT